MQITETENELIIRETPGCLWIFSLLFVGVGGALVYGALGGFVDWGSQSFWTLAAAFVMGSLGVAAGIWFIYGAPITRVVVDRIDEEVLVTRYGLFGKRQTLYDFEEIEQFALIEEKDDEGSLVWSLGMRLADGETIRISSLPSHDERFKSKFVFQTNEFMRKQLPPTEIIFEIEDTDETYLN